MGWLWLSQAVLLLKFFSFCDEFLDRRLPIFLSLTSVFTQCPLWSGFAFDLVFDFLIFPLLTPFLCVEGFCLWLRHCRAALKGFCLLVVNSGNFGTVACPRGELA